MTPRRAALVVTADDSTGATEAAAACADAGWSVEVVRFDVPSSTDGCVVVDLRSRHVDPDEARRRIDAVVTHARRVHKIDSTLRGNWAAELSALVAAGRRIVLIPSHPPAGRVCAGGVVLVNGVPVAESEHGNDPRLPVRTSRPSELLPASELAGPAQLAAWLAGSEASVAIVDALTLDDIDRLVSAALNSENVVIAGSASVVGAVARACSPSPIAPALPAPLLPEPVVAVCASLHPTSRVQMQALAAAGIDVVVSSDDRLGDPEVVAADVAERAHALVADVGARSVILVGGDTAAAFIGDNVVAVFGSIDVGISLGEADVRGRRLRIACKPGSFGTVNTLLDLVMRGTR
ncbi:MAG: four-carbon acid sugar kinase family protein [Ilumatobacteraceae bacterium]